MRQEENQLNRSWRERKNLLGFAQKKQTNKWQTTVRQKKISQLSSWQEQETFWALLNQKKRLMRQTSFETKNKLQQIQSESRKTRGLKYLTAKQTPQTETKGNAWMDNETTKRGGGGEKVEYYDNKTGQERSKEGKWEDAMKIPRDSPE